MTGCANCKITVEYWIRSGQCDSEYLREVQITEITYTPACTTSCLPTYNMQDIFQATIIFILKTVWYPPYKQCYDKVNVWLATCWKMEPLHKYIKCTTSDYCCYQGYKVCRAENGGITYWKLDPTSEFIICPPASNNDECFYICDWFPPNGSIPRVGFGGNQNEQKDLDISCTVKPNPTSGKTEFCISSPINGQGILTIFDNQGNELLKIDINKSNSDFVYPLDLSNQPSGIYHYRFTINNEKVFEGSFNIIK